MKKIESQELVSKPINLFKHLENLTFNKVEFDPLDDNQTKEYEPYMINRYVSMCEFYIPLVNAINKYDISKETHYRFLLASLPKRKQFFKYMSRAKDLLKDEKNKISKYFECGTRDLEEYLNILTEEQINNIVRKFDGGKENGRPNSKK